MKLINSFPAGNTIANIYERQIGDRTVTSINAWTTDAELQVLINAAQYYASKGECHAIEVGSWSGDSAIAICHGLSLGEYGGSLVCVDHWQGTPTDIAGEIAQHLALPIKEYFLQNTKGMGNVHPYDMPSKEAAEMLFKAGRTFDLIFLDGGHSYPEIMADLHSYWPLLAEGGVILGHDYASYFHGVVNAVNEFAALHGQEIWLQLDGTIWGLGNKSFTA